MSAAAAADAPRFAQDEPEQKTVVKTMRFTPTEDAAINDATTNTKKDFTAIIREALDLWFAANPSATKRKRSR